MAVALILLTGCTPQAGNAPATGSAAIAQPVPGYACPPAGTVVTYGDTASRTYQGVDPTDPAICLSTNAAGTLQRRIFDFYSTGTQSDSTIRAAMQSLYPMAVGRKAAFDAFFTADRGGTTLVYRDSFEVQGEERIAVGDQQVASWVLRRVQQGTGNNTFSTDKIYWVDKATGVFLRRVIGQTVGGVSQARGYEATVLRRGG